MSAQPVVTKINEIYLQEPVLDRPTDNGDVEGTIEVLGEHRNHVDLHPRKGRTEAVTDRREARLRIDIDAGKSLWARYAEGTAGRDPVKFLDVALDKTNGRQGRGRLAIDLGSGAGNEALVLLEHGWRVLAIDGEPRAIEILESRVPKALSPRLETRVAGFTSLSLPPADLVFASLSLPFAGDDLERVVGLALDAVAPAGWFVGVFFGVNDAWAVEPDIAVVRLDDIERWLADFSNVDIDEEEFDGPSDAGPKHWHWYVVSAQRPEAGSPAPGQE